jgi:outer membrane biosynthesis protein TonB
MKLRIVFLVCITTVLFAQETAEDTRLKLQQGVELFDQGKWQESLNAFNTVAESSPQNPIARFNTITLQAMTNQMQETEKFLEANENLGFLTSVQRGNAFYNLGTAYLGVAKAGDEAGQLMQAAPQLQASVKWLRKALLENPENYAAKNNLELANKLMEKLEQEQQQQNQDQNNDSDEGQNKEDSQEKQDSNNQQNKNQQQDKNNQDQQNQQNQQQNDKRQQQNISPEMAKNLLKAAKEKEKQALQTLRALIAKQKKSRGDKDY